MDQQKSLDERANTMEVQIRQLAMSGSLRSAWEFAPNAGGARAIITQLRTTRASGRVALPVNPQDKGINNFPNMVMEDNDR